MWLLCCANMNSFDVPHCQAQTTASRASGALCRVPRGNAHGRNLIFNCCVFFPLSTRVYPSTSHSRHLSHKHYGAAVIECSLRTDGHACSMPKRRRKTKRKMKHNILPPQTLRWVRRFEGLHCVRCGFCLKAYMIDHYEQQSNRHHHHQDPEPRASFIVHDWKYLI